MVDPNVFFRKTTVRICGSLNIERAMARCLRYIARHLPAAGMSLYLYDPELDALRTVAAVLPEHPRHLQRNLPVPDELRRVIRNEELQPHEILLINNPSAEPAYHLITQQIWDYDVSLVRLSLSLEGERIGMLLVYAPGLNRYRPEHAELLRLIREPFAIAMANALRYQELVRLKETLTDDNRYLQQELNRVAGDEIIGADFGLKTVMDRVWQVAPADTTVLLQGETGVGKELVANAIHDASPRRNGPLIKVNCGAIPETLLDSELFGHEKGAFTGAVSQRRGRFERAHTGTIFLDEIGELPPQAQVRLLRVLQQKEIERLGGTTVIDVDVRVICATHRNLETMVREGRFREDLWYRLNVFPIMIPPLRQRKVDIPALAAHFLERKARDLRISQPPHLAPGAIEQLRQYSWPGNVRELENVVERALISYNSGIAGGRLRFDLPTTPGESPVLPPEIDYSDSPPLDAVLRDYFTTLLKQCHGRIQGPDGAAQRAGLNPNTLRSKLRKLGIPYGRSPV